jgi:hypothetical protein
MERLALLCVGVEEALTAVRAVADVRQAPVGILVGVGLIEVRRLQLAPFAVRLSEHRCELDALALHRRIHDRKAEARHELRDQDRSTGGFEAIGIETANGWRRVVRIDLRRWPARRLADLEHAVAFGVEHHANRIALVAPLVRLDVAFPAAFVVRQAGARSHGRVVTDVHLVRRATHEREQRAGD